MSKQKLYQSLLDRLGGPTAAAKVLGVSQATASGWGLGSHGMSPKPARMAERATGGEFKAAELCDDLAELPEA